MVYINLLLNTANIILSFIIINFLYKKFMDIYENNVMEDNINLAEEMELGEMEKEDIKMEDLKLEEVGKEDIKLEEMELEAVGKEDISFGEVQLEDVEKDIVAEELELPEIVNPTIEEPIIDNKEKISVIEFEGANIKDGNISRRRKLALKLIRLDEQ